MASGKFEWGAVVNRQGQVCAIAVATDDPAQAWPGSQAISLSKAYTANGFSTDQLPLSTGKMLVDPFRPSSELQQLLSLRAAQLRRDAA